MKNEFLELDRNLAWMIEEGATLNQDALAGLKTLINGHPEFYETRAAISVAINPVKDEQERRWLYNFFHRRPVAENQNELF